MKKHRTLAASIALGLLGATMGGAAPASAGQVPQVTVSPGTAWAGQQVTISGEGCLVDGSHTGVMIELTLQSGSGDGQTISIPWGAQADGSWSARYRVPGTLPVGVYDVETTCYEVSATFPPPELTPVFDYASTALEVIEEPARGAVTATIDPISGPIGTTISVSGSGCPAVQVAVALLAGTSFENATAQIDHVIVVPAADGTWSAELTVYDSMVGGDDTVVGGDYVVAARCAYYDGEHVFSEPVAFDVTGEGEAPPPPEVQPSFLEPQALAAIPVAGDPSYTG
jgi:hypothetical protein